MAFKKNELAKDSEFHNYGFLLAFVYLYFHLLDKSLDMLIVRLGNL